MSSLLGGLTLAACTFVPLGFEDGQLRMHARSHWVVLEEALEGLWDRDPEEPLSAQEVYYFGGQVAGLGYLSVAGVGFALAGLLPRSRALARALFLLHAAVFWTLGLFLAALAGQDQRRGGVLLAVAALLGGLVFLETLLGVRAARAPRGLSPDAANLIPAGFLLVVEAGLFLGLQGHGEEWPPGRYLWGALGVALALTGMGLRRVYRAP